VVDMLNDFVLPGAPLEVPDARGIIPAIRARIEQARREGTPVIYLCDAHAEDDEEFKVWPSHAVTGTEGSKVIDRLAPEPGDIVLAKTTYSAFYKTQLENTLRRKNIRSLTIVGVVTNICILFTAYEAVVRGYEVEVPRDAVAALSPDEHDFALGQMAKVLRVEIT
jgi:nicotinamidase/pyrazinamidase